MDQALGPDGLVIPGVETPDADLVSSGTGESIWDLETPAPREAIVAIEQTLNATLSAGDEELTLDQTTSLLMEMNRAED